MQLPFDLATYDRRLQQTRQAMREAALEGLLLTLPASVYWLTGFDTTGFAYVVVDLSDEEPLFLTRYTEESGFHDTSWLRHADLFESASQPAADALVPLIRGRGLSQARMGVDLNSYGLAPLVWEGLKTQLPDVEFVDASLLIPSQRFVKTPAEIAYQRQAAAMADYAMERTLAAIRPGITETEIEGIAEHALGEAGSEYAATPPMVGGGTRSAVVHAMAMTGRTLALGDVVTVEVGAAVRRYHAISMRTVVVGRASPRLTSVAACVKEALEAAVAATTVGSLMVAPDLAANKVLARMDLARRRLHLVGYSLGIGYPPMWVEPMLLTAQDPHVFAPGMIYSIEPNIALPEEGFGIKLGDTVLCTEDGPERLTTHGLDLVVL